MDPEPRVGCWRLLAFVSRA